MIRVAEKKDIVPLVDLGVEALSIDAYGLVVDRKKLFETAYTVVGSKQHFAWVSEERGIVKGALVAMVHDSELYTCRQAVIYMWFCKVKGDGIRMMRKFLEWVRSKPMIRQVVYVTERKGDKRICDVVARLGFEACAMYVLTR
jgi:hypothetical protein